MNDYLTLNLKPQELDLVAQALTNMPWGQVNALMVNIQNQVVQQQQQAQPPTESPQMSLVPNGHDQTVNLS